MGFTLEKVVPWGRSFDEYTAMFALSDMELQERILGCGDGPAAFNASLSKQGRRIVSADPLYRYSVEDIRARIDETFAEVMVQTRKNSHEFLWTNIKSVDDLGRIRMAAMEDFLADYPQGKEQGRYLDCELPNLPFADSEFDLALCSHFLFLYSEQFTEEFHLASIKELCRIAREVRIFPLLELGSITSRHLQTVTDGLTADGYSVSVVPVAYEFQRGGNQIMKVRA
jgi:hypothetical protein